MKSNQSTPVPLLDVVRQNRLLMSDLQDAFNEVLCSGRFIMGPQVEAFEAECAQALGVKHAIAVSSGTDALLVSLMALDIGPGDEVICPSYSFFATAGSVSRVGARPVLVDVDPDTLNIAPHAVEQAISKHTKAIMPVHLFGQCANMLAIAEIADRHGLLVIEDAAQAFGSRSEAGTAGAVGRVGCFSFFPSKNLGGFGDGGLVTTQDFDLNDRIRTLRAHGAKPKYFHKEIGGNFRMDALQCALMRVKLPHLKRYVDGRRENAKQYDLQFKQMGLAVTPETPDGPLRLPEISPLHNFNQYVIQTRTAKSREQLKAHLRYCNIGCEVYYPRPLHVQECYSHLAGGIGDCPVAELAAETTLAIPVFAELLSSEIQDVADCIFGFFGN